ncbi:Crp/Fnr family transcriptional regulator [Terrimonas sp. NA20]|uniref:Crp/Fnr family transcriptional regulator n=1 Tax=Terrimonas ginsenosidimutans TaxID=2908004 RepID=A0ABS9KMF7_9BACT|nr:Crp/Fnr family transcriptional regulator [Terrimonas ginsenosidimutans]MCG2613510.1 Crp/Fnr family transcriptional regulator [Terrimonas ginsenosidimutans]
MKTLKQPCNQDRCLLCKLCLKEWLPAIAASHKNFELKKGELLFREGELMTGIYFVYQGTVKVHKHWGNDKELIVRFARDGQIVGHRGLGGDNHYPVSATALEKTVVCFIDNDLFYASLKVNHELLLQLMLFFAGELKESEKNMRNLAHMPVKGRIAQAFLTLSAHFGDQFHETINEKISRQDLASYVGTTYETLFRMLNEMDAEGLIVFNDKQISINSQEVLRSYIGGFNIG